jgi:putative ABC transport system permease protein
MKWFDSACARLRLLFARRGAESRMNDEFRFHIEMETDQLVRTKGLAPDEARRHALAAFGGVETGATY